MRTSIILMRLDALVLAVCLMYTGLLYAQPDKTNHAVQLIGENCHRCHGGDWATEAGVDFTDLYDEVSIWKYRDIYTRALDMLKRGKMPPPDEPEIPESDRLNLIKWLNYTLENVDIDRIPRDPGFLPPRRLNRYQYQYTIQDLFGMDSLPGGLLPPDLTTEGSFDNNVATLSFDPLWFEHALTAARMMVNTVWSDSDLLNSVLFIRPTPPFFEERALYVSTNEQARKLDMGDGDFSVLALVSGAGGNILLKSIPLSGFRHGSIQLSFNKHSITYQIGPGRKMMIDDLDLDENNSHLIALSVKDHRASIFLDGRLLASVANFSKPDSDDNLFKVGKAARYEKDDIIDNDESDDKYSLPKIEDFLFYSNALSEETILNYRVDRQNEEIPKPAFHWYPGKESPRPEVITAPQAATDILDQFLLKAFRRPPTKDETDRYLNLFLESFDAGFAFYLAMQVPIFAALSSPSFLLHSEQATKGKETYAVSSIDMASRLSYFLWSSAPDEQLISAGIAGRLLDPKEILRQTNRMLADDKAERFFERFVLQWLRTEGLGDTYRPDESRFSEINESLMLSMRQEGVMVVGNVIRENHSLLRLLYDKSTFLNKELAAHYGYEKLVTGLEWEKVELNDSNRGGLLTQAAVLTVSSSPRRTSPVLRGKWVLDVLLGEPPQPPPPDIPTLPAEAESSSTSLRELLAAHRNQAACAACHDKIDPYGLVLEQYDAVGRLRTENQNTFTTLWNGETLDGATELRQFLLEEKSNTFIRNLTEKVLAYALNRDLTFSDERSVYHILQQLENDGFLARTLINGIVLSEPFRYRKNP